MRKPVRSFYVYIMANPWSRVLYTGMTNDLARRVAQHKAREVPGFTQRYNVTSLVYFEEADGPLAAIEREKHIKGWSRAKRIALIEGINPDWRDLSLEWTEGAVVRGEGAKAPDASLRSA
jgi:putative endonuclease